MGPLTGGCEYNHGETLYASLHPTNCETRVKRVTKHECMVCVLCVVLFIKFYYYYYVPSKIVQHFHCRRDGSTDGGM